jgi:GNAT superfamily N-acetyltransferase
MSEPRGGISIRAAAAGDAPALAFLMTELGYPVTTEVMTERLDAILPRADFTALVAEGDGAVVAMIGLQVTPSFEKDGLHGRILALCVAPDRRGRGIGSALVQAGESWCRDRGAVTMRVTSAVHRAETHRFYESLGYPQTGLRFVKVL